MKGEKKYCLNISTKILLPGCPRSSGGAGAWTGREGEVRNWHLHRGGETLLPSGGVAPGGGRGWGGRCAGGGERAHADGERDHGVGQATGRVGLRLLAVALIIFNIEN